MNGKESERFSIDPANHFLKMLLHFNKVINDVKLQEIEDCQNLTQARLLKEFKIISNGG